MSCYNMAGSKGQVMPDFGQLWEELKSRPLLDIVGISSLSTVGTLLNVSNPGVTKGWEALAEKLGYSRVEVEALRHEGNKLYQKTPGELLLEVWGGRGASSTLQVLEQALRDLDRPDVLEELQKAVKDECALSVTFCTGQQERSLTLPGVLGMSTLRQALEGAVKQTGLRTDDLEIQGSEMTWTTRARECKGIHLRLVKKGCPQPPEHDVRNVRKSPPTDSPRKLPIVDKNAVVKAGGNNRSSKKANTVSGPNNRDRPPLPLRRGQSDRSALRPKHPPTAATIINVFATPGTNINIVNENSTLSAATSSVDGKSVTCRPIEASESSAQNAKENVLPTQRSENSAERSGLSSAVTIGKESKSVTTETCSPVEETKKQTILSSGMPVKETKEQTPPLSGVPVEETRGETQLSSDVPIEETTELTPSFSAVPIEEQSLLSSGVPVEETKNQTQISSGLPIEETRKQILLSSTSPVEETRELTPPLAKENKTSTSGKAFHKDQDILTGRDSSAPRPRAEVATQPNVRPKLPPKRTKSTTIAPQVPQQEEGFLQHTLPFQEDDYSLPLGGAGQHAHPSRTSGRIISDRPCGSGCHGDRRRRVDSVLDDVTWEEVAKVPGFHHHIPDDPAAIHTFMFNYLRDEGWYVIRKCADDKLAVSVTYLGDIRHYRIHRADGRFYFRRDEFQARSLHELLETYKWNDLPAKPADRPSSSSSSPNNGAAQSLSTPPVPTRDRGVRLLKPVT
ncbi:Hypp3036 [Branchiostoma lanceolatum]|uniref:Hypp3036 protein n=1 Tax=Branchiostoma lanceolatum TaxID=7740 RepID=A0A8J9ZYI3_BRALA|nr:Hypp3036 [Branchiostoma lanceolatum]